jgi:hypothetical protein
VSQRFAYTDYCAAGTPASSADATGYPKENAQNAARWKRWRSSTTTGNQNLDVDFGTSKTLQFVAVVDVTAHAGGTVKAQYWTGAIWTDLGTFTFSTITGVGVLWVSQATTKVRILFTNTGAVSSYVEVGVVLAGAYFQPTKQLRPGAALVRRDPTEYSFSVDGQGYAQRRTRYYSMEGEFAPMASTDRDAFITMYETVGRFKPFIFAFDHATMDRCIYGRFDDTLELDHVDGSVDKWAAKVAVMEVR